MVDLDSLEAFVVFAEKLNFTHAAEALHISQPALHVKVRKLGESLGVSLYRREGRELRLTAAGKRVASFARDMRSNVAEFRSQLQGQANAEPIELAAGEGSLLYLLPDAIRTFTRSAAAPLKILRRDRDGMLDAIRSGEAQLGVGTLDVIPDDLSATRIARASQLVVVPRRHPLSRLEQVRPEDLDGSALIVPPEGRPHRDMIARMLLDCGASWRVAVEAHGWPVMLELARSGAGIAIVNSICRLPSGVVARPLLRFPATHYYFVHRKGRLSEWLALLTKLIRRSA
jgi:DNA-binding transcriptional LysR family regulator